MSTATAIPTQPGPTKTEAVRLATDLTSALRSLEYVGCWATLDGAESSSLSHAIDLVRRVRNDLDASTPGHSPT